LLDIEIDKQELLEINPNRFDNIKADSQSKWLKWLHKQTHNKEIHKPNMLPPARNEALHEFDNIYLDRIDYTVVAKFKDYAPFIGLLLTAFSVFCFYSSDLSNVGDLTTGELVKRVLPLLSGVAFGALLNLICSGLLQLISYFLSEYRQVAFDWFDEATAEARDVLAASAQAQIVAEIASTNKDLAEHIKQFLNKAWEGTTLVQNEALVNMKKIQQDYNQLHESAQSATKAARIACAEAAQAAKTLGSTVEQLSLNLGPNITSLSETLSTNARQFQEFSENHATELRSISESTHLLGQAWTNLYPEITTIVSGTKHLVESTRLFEEALRPAAHAIQLASQQYVEFTKEMGESAQAVRENSEELKSSLANHSNILESVNVSVQNTLIPTCSVLSNYAVALQQNSERLDSTTQILVRNLETASMGSGRLENVALQFETIINNQFLPAMTAVGHFPEMMSDFFNEIQGAGRNLWDSSSAFRQVFEDNRNHLDLANTSISHFRNLINNSTSAFSNLNKSTDSFSHFIDKFQETAVLLSKVNDGLGPVPVELREFLTELRKVESLSVNVDSLGAHLQKLNGVATELVNARDSLAAFVTTLKVVIDTAAKITPPPTKGWFG
jgi:methyl-accepting chemotaxis protein